MQISYNWLRSLLPVEIDLQSACERLTVIGLEVEGVTTLGISKDQLQGLVVGHVLECDKHPNADKLSLTQVDIGQEEPVQIVCGAPNVAKGQKVVVATVGAVLHPSGSDSFKIKKAKIRGEVSFGMICAEDEIGLSGGHDGIMVLEEHLQAGTPFSEIIDIEEDHIIEIGLTPNRGDATSHWGVARDLWANMRASGAADEEMSFPELYDLSNVERSSWDIQIEDETACRRYAGLWIEQVKVGPSPAWLKDRLQSLGMNSVNNIVDVTNFVMLELGQPLHAFDTDKINGNTIKVGYVADRSKFLALDGEQYTLRESDLLIKNGEDQPMCLAGVFGGKNFETDLDTKSIFLEAAYFDPKKVRSSSLHHQLRTQSATIFEKQSDPDMCIRALSRAAQLLLKLDDDIEIKSMLDIYPVVMSAAEVTLRHSRVNKMIGQVIPRETIENILNALEIKIMDTDADSWHLSIPRYRGDVTREIDIIEEIIRIYGLDNIPLPERLRSSIAHDAGSKKHLFRRDLSVKLTGMGFSEMMNVSLTMDQYYPERNDLVFIENTSNTTLNIMRPELLHPALHSIAYNLNRQQRRLKFFEFGRSYQRQDSEILEKEQLILVMSGSRYAQSWLTKEENVDEHDLTGICSALFQDLGLDLQQENHPESTYFNRGFQFLMNEEVVCEGGLISGRVLAMHDIEEEVFAAVIDMSLIFENRKEDRKIYQEISKFPTVERHLAIKIKENVKFGDIQALIKNIEKTLVSEITLIDVYKDEEMIQEGEKSYAIRVLFSSMDRTLKDEEIDQMMTEIMKNLGEQFSAVIRK